MKKIGPFLSIADDVLPNMHDAFEADSQRGGSHEMNNFVAKQINALCPTILAMAHEIEQQRDELLLRMAVLQPRQKGRKRGRPLNGTIVLHELGTAPDQVLATKWGVAVHTVARYRRLAGKPAVTDPDRPHVRLWKTWDWTLTDAELARQKLRSRERIRQIRQLLGYKPQLIRRDEIKTEREREFVGWAKLNHEPDRPNVIALKRAEQAGFNATSVRKWAFNHKLKVHADRSTRRMPVWDYLNWELPNWALEEIWQLAIHQVAMHRSRYGMPAAPYVKREEVDGTRYAALIEQEKLRAARFRAHPPEQHGRGNGRE